MEIILRIRNYATFPFALGDMLEYTFSEKRGEKMNIKIKKNEVEPESTEILAEAIVRIGEGFKKLESSGLNQRAIVVLIQDATKLSKGDIETVLDALPRLAGWYCRK